MPTPMLTFIEAACGKPSSQGAAISHSPRIRVIRSSHSENTTIAAMSVIDAVARMPTGETPDGAKMFKFGVPLGRGHPFRLMSSIRRIAPAPPCGMINGVNFMKTYQWFMRPEHRPPAG